MRHLVQKEILTAPLVAHRQLNYRKFEPLLELVHRELGHRELAHRELEHRELAHREFPHA